MPPPELPPPRLETGETSDSKDSGQYEKGLSEESNIVDWDGPDDPMNPLNWSAAKKHTHVAIVSLFTLSALVFSSSPIAHNNADMHIITCVIRNLAATMFAPGVQELVSEFSITDSTVAAMTVSLYVLGFALGPIILAPLSELYGRLIIYLVCNVVYLAFTLGCAFATNTAMFLVFRFICGCAAAGPMSIGGGTIADVTPQDKRGKAMALFAMGPILGPVSDPPFSSLKEIFYFKTLAIGCWAHHRWLRVRGYWLALDLSDPLDSGEFSRVPSACRTSLTISSSHSPESSL